MNAEQSLTNNEPPNSEPAVVTPAKELTPISASKRIDVMDILRGFALIGIILMNIEWFNRSITELGGFDFSLTGVDWSAGWLVRLLVEGKFYKLFSLLFGMGFAVMLLRAQEVGRPFGAWFSRRMIILFLFGMAHMVFLWGGDILHDYAVGGLYLLVWIGLTSVKKIYKFNNPLRRFGNPRSMMRFGVCLLMLPTLFALSAGVYFGNTRTQAVMNDDFVERKAVIARADTIVDNETLSATLRAKVESVKAGDSERDEVDEDLLSPENLIEYKGRRRFMNEYRRELSSAEEAQALGKGTYWEATVYRSKEALDSLGSTPIFAALMGFPTFMIGYWFIASGVIRRPKEHLGIFKVMAWVGLGFGLLMGTSSLLVMAHPISESAIEARAVSQVMFMVSQFFMTAGYLGAIVLAALTIRGKRWLSWLAPLGRMALTNYIMHSVILSSIFFGYAGGMFGEISRGPQVLIVVAIITGQALLSAWWLNRYKFGPLEWLWRSLTYMKAQPMKVEDRESNVPTQSATTS